MRNSLEYQSAVTPVTALSVVHQQSSAFLFTGEGSFLRVFDHATGRFLAETQIFNSQCIHGISVYESSKLNIECKEHILLIWGGRSVRAVRAAYSEDPTAGHNALHISCSGLETRCSDWILDLAFLPEDLSTDDELPGLRSAVLVTAHNELLILRVEHDQNTSLECQVLVKSLVGGPRSVLYSAHVLWLSPTHVLVAGGTVFGEVLVWSCHGKRILWDSSCSTIYLHHTLSGHHGSIYGVHISPAIIRCGLGYPIRLLASCSDDRQIRIWQVPDMDALNPAEQSNLGNDASEAPEGAVTPRYTFEESLQPGSCIASVWAHVSRIWSVKFIPPCPDTEFNRRSIDLISVGEDATMQRWSLTLQNQSSSATQKLVDTYAQLKHVSTWDFHSGKNIWSSMVTAHRPSSWDLITGGADGKIVSYEVSLAEIAAIKDYLSIHTSNDVREVSGCSKNAMATSNEALYSSSQHQDVRIEAQDQKPCVNGFPLLHHATQSQAGKSNAPELCSYKIQRYTFVEKETLLATTIAGQVIVGSLCNAYSADSGYTSQTGPDETPTRVNWSIIRQFDNLRSYSSLVGVPAYRMAFLSGMDGTIYAYDHDIKVIRPFLAVHKKITGLYAQTISQTDLVKEDITVGLVATVLGSSSAHYWLVKREHSQTSKGSVEVLRTWTLDLPPALNVTSAHSMFLPNLLFLGSRNGALLIYNLSSPDRTPDNLRLWASFPRLHGDDAITVIMTVTQLPSHDEDRCVYILTAGRDGKYSVHCLYYQQHPDSQPKVRLETVHTSCPPIGRNIEGACFHGLFRDLIVWGFRGKYFVAWNESKQIKIMSIECGGSHREWSFSYDDDEGGSLAWTKVSKLNLHRQQRPAYRVIKEGGHGREIKALAVFTPRDGKDHSPTSLIVTGAEDTSLRLFVHRHDPASRNSPEFQGSGGFRKHTTGIQHLQWCGQAGFLFSSGGFEEFYVWRARNIPGFGVGMVCEAECPALGVPLDLRVMSFHVLDVSDKSASTDQLNCFLISVVYSDSTIRVYRYISSSTVHRFDLLSTGTYTACCLTQVQFLVSSSSLYLATTATDGYITFWDVFESLKRHGVTVNAGRVRTRTQPRLPDPDMVSWQTRLRVHWSAIKCMAVAQVAEDSFLVLTGADDNALALARVTLRSHLQAGEVQCSILLVPKAHASAVTAITLVDYPVANRDLSPQLRFATSSNDQKLKIWSACVDLSKPGVEGLQITKASDVYTSVADVSSMDTLTDGSDKKRVLVCGVGMELWNING